MLEHPARRRRAAHRPEDDPAPHVRRAVRVEQTRRLQVVLGLRDRGRIVQPPPGGDALLVAVVVARDHREPADQGGREQRDGNADGRRAAASGGDGGIVPASPPAGRANTVSAMLISVVAPVYNEIETLPEFHRRVSAALADQDYELLLVDDGSTDGSAALIDGLAGEDPRVRPLHLSRNFGHQAAITAGLREARGAAAVTIDADLQDPPEVIPRLVEAWREGAEVVHGVRHQRAGESRRRLFAISAFYRVFDRLSGLSDFPGNSGDFRLIARPALDAVNALPEHNRFVRGLVSWVGFRQASVVYERDARHAGSSKYPFRKLAGLAADGILSFSAVPLRIAAWLGLAMSLTAFVAIPVVIVLRLAGLYHVSGIASIHILVLLVGGVQLLFLGVLGEYLARNYDETKRRPVYILREPPPDQGG
jgi:polyisoprenyl-phosphate glycosyltransferase